MDNSSQKGFGQIFILILLVLGLIVGVILVQRQTNLLPKANDIKKPYIVVLNEEAEADEHAVERVLSENTLPEKQKFKKTFKGFSADLDEKQLEKVKKDKRVKFVSED